jgi:hypothetical protein
MDRDFRQMVAFFRVDDSIRHPDSVRGRCLQPRRRSRAGYLAIEPVSISLARLDALPDPLRYLDLSREMAF